MVDHGKHHDSENGGVKIHDSTVVDLSTLDGQNVRVRTCQGINFHFLQINIAQFAPICETFTLSRGGASRSSPTNPFIMRSAAMLCRALSRKYSYNMDDTKFHERLQQIARKAGFSVKGLSFKYVAGEVRKRLHDDAAPAAILAAMRDVRLLKPDQFGTATAMLNFENSTAMERLEAANQQMAAQREEEKRAADLTKPKVTLTPRELALPPDARLSVYEEKLAAAIAAKKVN